MPTSKALLVVDIQNDFCPGGSLGVKDGDKIIPLINQYVELFLANDLPIFVSRDWHPAEARHFQPFGGPWPIHCVQHSKGGEFHPAFRVPDQAIIVSKGTDPQLDGYSVFEAIDADSKPFPEILKNLGITELHIAGIATDYCVKFTAIDALKNGYNLTVLVDAIKGVNEEASEQTLKEISAQQARLKTFGEIKKELEKNIYTR